MVQCTLTVHSSREECELLLVGHAGLHFIVDSDITNLSRFNLDRAGRSILIILRHTGRIREVRGGGLTRYCIC